MNFIIDAQLPKRLADLFIAAGHDALHTLDLPKQNRTTDEQIEQIADQQQRVVVSKDRDFVTSFWLRDKPQKLLLISTGNISNDRLLAIFSSNLDRLISFARAVAVR